MTTHTITTRDEWLEARLDLLAAEKDLTRRSDEIARLRQRLPWVRVDKVYRFDTDGGSKTLKDLFDGCSQLMVYHFMFGPDYKAGCASCSAIADGFNGIVVHLENHDVAFTAVSRAPLATHGLSLHVRAGLQGRLCVLLGDRRRLQRHLRPFGKS